MSLLQLELEAELVFYLPEEACLLVGVDTESYLHEFVVVV